MYNIMIILGEFEELFIILKEQNFRSKQIY